MLIKAEKRVKNYYHAMSIVMSEHKHWSEQLADRVIEEKKEPYIITGGMTTSGPVHFGTLCELLFPFAIKRELEQKGKKAEYYFIADIMDAFDSVPVAMEKYKGELEPHLGKPLCDVPDPTGKSNSFGEHFLDEAKRLVEKFGIKTKFVKINDYYKQGKFDELAKFFLKHEDEARKIIEETSGKEEKKDWSPIMPVCQNCGRVATTVVTGHDEDGYEYSCTRDVGYTKGCGFKGKNKISDHEYKIVWRLHWPAWKQVFGTSIEGAGMDHHTKGGSVDTSNAIISKLMKKEPPIEYKYGFILFNGKKYSKSKGTGMGITQISRLLPPEIIKYMLLLPDLEENVDIVPTAQRFLETVYRFEQASKIDINQTDISRADRKKAIAFSLSTDKIQWEASFLDVLLYYQLYKDWNKVATLLDDPNGVGYLEPYIENWIEENFVPEDYSFKYEPGEAGDNVKKFAAGLRKDMDAVAIHNAVFDFAKANGIVPKEFFAEIYHALIRKKRGPRLGKLIAAIGVERVKKDLGV